MGVLDGKVAIVTGSARGIGRATAEILSEHGASVVINDLDADVAQQTASEIGGETAVFAGDLTGGRRPRPARADGDRQLRAHRHHRQQRRLHARRADPQDERRLVEPDARHPRHRPVQGDPRRRAAPARAGQGREGRGPEVFRKIVNVSSVSGTMGNAGQANYSAGKSAVVGLTKTLAKEWGQFKVNCNAVAFGYIETRLTASKDDSNVMEIGGEKVQLGIPDQLRGMASMLIPLGRPGTPEEAAGGVFFLCSPWSNYVHGQVLNVTGGQFTGMTT